MLDRERREPGVRNAGPADSRFEANSRKNRPMPPAWLDGLTMRLTEQVVAKTEDLFDRAGMREHSGIGGYPNYRAQHRRRNTEPGIASHNPIEPRLTNLMIGRILAERMNEHVDIGQNHRSGRASSRSSISCKAAESLTSTPGIKPPVATLTRGKLRTADFSCGSSLTTRRRPSSIMAVRESPSAAALSLARRTRSSGRRTVVLSDICHDISGLRAICQSPGLSFPADRRADRESRAAATGGRA
jgi:hypothetical protein